MGRKLRWLCYTREALHGQRQARCRPAENSFDLNEMEFPTRCNGLEKTCLNASSIWQSYFFYNLPTLLLFMNIIDLISPEICFRFWNSFAVILSLKDDERSSWAAGGLRHVLNLGRIDRKKEVKYAKPIYASTQSSTQSKIGRRYTNHTKATDTPTHI